MNPAAPSDPSALATSVNPTAFASASSEIRLFRHRRVAFTTSRTSA